MDILKHTLQQEAEVGIVNTWPIVEQWKEKVAELLIGKTPEQIIDGLIEKCWKNVDLIVEEINKMSEEEKIKLMDYVKPLVKRIWWKEFKLQRWQLELVNNNFAKYLKQNIAMVLVKFILITYHDKSFLLNKKTNLYESEKEIDIILKEEWYNLG